MDAALRKSVCKTLVRINGCVKISDEKPVVRLERLPAAKRQVLS